jgi:hypothetical protein
LVDGENVEATDAALLKELGDRRLRGMRDQGAAMNAGVTVAYPRRS